MEVWVGGAPRIVASRAAGHHYINETTQSGGHQPDTIGQHRRFVARMGNEQNCRSRPPAQAQYFLAYYQSRLLMEDSEGLVEQDGLWLQHQRAHDTGALAHIAGEFGEPIEIECVIDTSD